MHDLEITRPDDWHVHVRDNELLSQTVHDLSLHFERALLMPNLNPPLTTLQSLIDYRERVLQMSSSAFTPYFTFYLNESVNPEELMQAKTHAFILGAKLYPQGATTNSSQGARHLKSLYPLLEVMQSQGLVLQIHGEGATADIFDREALFIKEELTPILKHFPKLKIVLEHISTKCAVDFVQNTPKNLAATITPHHLRYNRNDLLSGGLKPHHYCLPILKRETDRQALILAATSGNPQFFAGTDSAPHAIEQKESACGCAGIYGSPYALAIYAELFEKAGKLDKLNDFMGRFGALFYELPLTQKTIRLMKKAQRVPDKLPFGGSHVVPLAAGETLSWSIDV